MKAMKYVGLATLAAVTLGFATPAFAADGGDIENEGKNGYTDVTVAVDKSDTFKLVSVPAEFNFDTKLQDSAYSLTIGSETVNKDKLEEEIKVYRGYTIEDDDTEADAIPITVSIESLSVSRDGAKVGTVAVDELAIGGKKLVGTGFGGFLTDQDFDNAATATIAHAINSATIGFDDEYNPSKDVKAELKVNDKLTTQITYTIDNASTGE